MRNLTLQEMYDLSHAYTVWQGWENDNHYNAEMVRVRRDDFYAMCEKTKTPSNVAEIISYYVQRHQELFHKAVTEGRGSYTHL